MKSLSDGAPLPRLRRLQPFKPVPIAKWPSGGATIFGKRKMSRSCARRKCAAPARESVGVRLLALALCACDAPTHVRTDSLEAAIDSPDVQSDATRPASPLSPSYALSTDIETHLNALHARLGQDLRVVRLQEVFVFVGPKATPSFDAGVALARKALDAYFNGRFSTRPDRAVFAVLFPSTSAYEAYCLERFGAKCGTSYGLYSHATREIVVDLSPGLATLTHELVHPIVQTDFPRAPAWIDEGLASLYESPTFPHEGEVRGASNWRGASLVRALSSPEKALSVRLDSLFDMTDATFHDVDEDLHYAMARYACLWLDSLGKLWPFYREWRDSTGDATGAMAFSRVMGRPPVEANDEWVRWVRKR
jgi:hypothetical protein